MPSDSSKEYPPAAVPAGGLSLVAIANMLLRRRRLLLAVATTAALVAGVYKLTKGRAYTVQSSFIIENKDGSGAAGIAAQLGVDVGGIDVTKSPEFYVALLKTPDVQGRLADALFATSKNRMRRRLADIWEVTPKEPALRREAVLKLLKDAISSSAGLKVDVIQLSVTTDDPVVSKEISDSALAEVNNFNLRTRQSRAGAERRFTEARMNELRSELTVAEQEIQRFYELNRQSVFSPALDVEKDRFNRKLNLAQQTYNQVAQAYERSRIEEVRDTPLITIIQHPMLPLRPDPRGLVTGAVLAFIVSLLGGSIIVLLIDILRSMRGSPDVETVEFNRLVGDAIRDLQSMRGILTRLKSRSAKTNSLPN
ncbi:hypothetical protein BH09GEM1_BH09GEM1_35730 [soil metagenome]